MNSKNDNQAPSQNLNGDVNQNTDDTRDSHSQCHEKMCCPMMHCCPMKHHCPIFMQFKAKGEFEIDKGYLPYKYDTEMRQEHHYEPTQHYEPTHYAPQYTPQYTPYTPYYAPQYTPYYAPVAPSGAPTSPPPAYTPSQAYSTPGTQPLCTNRYIYLWLTDGTNFWAWLTSTDSIRAYGYSWNSSTSTWQSFQVRLSRISSFSCQ